MFEKIRNYYKKTDALLVVYLLFLSSEILSKFLNHLDIGFSRLSVFVKVFFLIYFALFILFKRHKFNKNTIYTVVLVVVLFLFGGWMNSLSGGVQNIQHNILYLGKYLFIFILFDYYSLFSRKSKDRLYTFIEAFLIFNSAVIIIATIFKIDIFQTYLRGDRFGYNGLLYMNSQSTYIYIFLIAVYLNQYIYTSKVKAKYVLILVASILTGTKAILLFLGLMSVYLFVRKKWYMNKCFYLTFVLITLLFPVIKGFVFPPQFELLTLYFKEYGLLTMLFSGRNYLFQEAMFIVSNEYDTLSILFGGFPFYDLRTELGFIDIFLFFGIIGGVMYLYFYIKILFKDLLLLKKPFIYYFLASLFLVVFLGGNFFTNAIISIYILVFVDRLKQAYSMQEQ
jgi:hypothetical protein